MKLYNAFFFIKIYNYIKNAIILKEIKWNTAYFDDLIYKLL